MKNAVLILVFGILASAQFSYADQSCSAQLAAKDKQIQRLMDIIANNGGNAGNGTVVVEKPFTCQAICIENLIGKGWHPGDEFRYNAIETANNEKDAWSKVVSACNTDLQKNFREGQANYASANIAGYVTVADMNSNDWEEKMVKSFNNDVDLRRFCSDR